MRKLFPPWFYAALGLVTVLFVGLNVKYRLGADRVKVKGARVDFDRKFDRRMFRVDDRLAFSIAARGGGEPHVSLVKYRRAAFPFCPLCGTVEPAGSALNLADFRQGDWVYGRYTFAKRPIAYNLRTGEVVVSAKTGREPSAGAPRPSDEPFYVQQGFTFDDARRTSAQLAALPELAVVNESCLVFNVAILLVYGILLLIAIGFLVRFALGRRAA